MFQESKDYQSSTTVALHCVRDLGFFDCVASLYLASVLRDPKALTDY